MFTQTALVGEMDSLKKFALRLTGNMVEADDLLQSTILRAMEKKDYFQPGTDLFKWMSKIMFNLFVSTYRRKKKFETRYDPEGYLEKASVDPAQEAKVELRLVREAMKKLSGEHQEILMLVCVKGMRYQEVAGMLDIPVGTVRSRLSRAREHLQAIMDSDAAARRINTGHNHHIMARGMAGHRGTFATAA
jgi:RNA polymerase sigma-70 factor (ECF subfamily)